jgi:isopentenyl-diphosphate delta-isomerase
MEERVVLVDPRGAEIGTAEKLDAHRWARLHRAVSVFVFNGMGEVLLQRRSSGKYHSPGRWSNACCGHPRPGESPLGAARRRLVEEMGLECELTEVLRFTYRADVGGGLVEHEYDHVFLGRSNAVPRPDPAEAEAWCWMPLRALRESLCAAPERYTSWFPLALNQLGGRGLLPPGGLIAE